jgi:hypothetical protein
MSVKKDIRYINKDFSQFRESLIAFAKNYYPTTYNDFNETSPGMMFIEMASYVGDVLSFYTDTQLRESLLSQVEERGNLLTLASILGSKPRSKTAANVKLDVFQLLPVVGSSPDYSYALSFEPNAQITATNGRRYRTIDSVDFRFSSSIDPTEVTVYQTSGGTVQYYLLKKQVAAVSGEIKTANYTFSDPKAYDKIVLPDTDVLEIIDVVDSDGNIWYETPYLAQDTIVDSIQNVPFNDPQLSTYRSSVPYLLKLRRTPRRFVTRLREDGLLEMQFGAGVSSDRDEEIIPNPLNVGMGLTYFANSTDASIDPSNFLYTKTYGLVPQNTTLSIRYTVGGGVIDNVGINTINELTRTSVNYNNATETLDPTVLTTIQNSLVFNNALPAIGGADERDIESMRLDAMANFATQNRIVTKEDYIVRAYAMPAKFGTVHKAYVVPDDQIQTANQDTRIPNSMAIDLYVLGYDGNRNLVALNQAIKENLRNYLSQYRMLTDAINIKDAFIINFGIDYEIIVRPNYNASEVLVKCTNYLKKKFDADKMQINQPLFISNLYSELDSIDGVQTVVNVTFKNLYDSTAGYSDNIYSFEAATKNGIVYPSLDPAIFEIKYPNQDIRGRAVAI